jgi:hypothetical protein
MPRASSLLRPIHSIFLESALNLAPKLVVDDSEVPCGLDDPLTCRVWPDANGTGSGLDDLTSSIVHELADVKPVGEHAVST